MRKLNFVLLSLLPILLSTSSCDSNACQPTDNEVRLLTKPSTISTFLESGMYHAERNSYISSRESLQRFIDARSNYGGADALLEVLGLYTTSKKDFFRTSALIVTTISHSSSQKNFVLESILFNFLLNSFESRFSCFSPPGLDTDIWFKSFVTEIPRFCEVDESTVSGSYVVNNTPVFDSQNAFNFEGGFTNA